MVGHLIKSWSYSGWSTFQKCKYRAFLEKVEKRLQLPKIQDPDKEHPMDRGSRIHDAAELYIRNEAELIPELKFFTTELIHLRDLYTDGLVETEGEWGFTQDWKTVAWQSNDVWLRAKLDSLVKTENDQAIVIDYKTGKSWGNEVAHATQGQLYQLATFMRYPEINHVTVEFWYIDQNEVTKSNYSREKGLKFLNTWNQRGLAITTETEFKANPSEMACKWCPYGKNSGTGDCEYQL